ncbi:MAG: efflux RND transporter periplasmic adaptor subunit, partial [Methylococcaceae bacterium]
LKAYTQAHLKRTVIAIHPKSSDSARRITLPASLRGNAETPLYARSNGYLSSWLKTIGDSVQKGELLATIDVPELEHERAEATAQRHQVKTRLDLARSTLKRWEVLRRTDSAAQQDYEERRSAVSLAEADLEAAEARLKRLLQIEDFRHITAPFSGVISRRTVEVGNLINPSQELFALTQTDPLRLSVWVPQNYASEVKPGQEVSVRVPDAPGKTLNARVDHVAGALEPLNRARQVDITLANPEGRWLPGAYAEVSFNLNVRTKTWLIPANALIIDQSGVRVATVDTEQRVAFRSIRLGRDFGREVEVLEGIQPSDVLVASPSDLLMAGEIVNPIEAPPAHP